MLLYTEICNLGTDNFSVLILGCAQNSTKPAGGALSGILGDVKMEKKRKIAQYRERLDEALASPELTNKETLKTLVQNQLLNSSCDETGGCAGLRENVVERKTTDVFNFLDLLRSASVKDNEVLKTSEASHRQWKLKQDTEEVRIMYCEGPQGTPFHSLLVEGYIDAPLDVCLCVSWESALYRIWWPQYSFPPFKIITCNCLQKVWIGEQISLVRVKVTWPLSSREAVVHYFVFEYFQEGLMLTLLTSIDDLKSIDRTTHGFTNEGIPEAKDVVRIELMGGFALQKVAEDRSFFRTILNMDMKLNFVPPSLINFISRQLVGDGFKLYQKAVTSVSSYEDYRKALEKPLYSRIREALYSRKESKEGLKNGACIPPKEHLIEFMQDGLNEIEQNVHIINDDSEYFHIDVQVTDRNVGEIEEEDSKENTHNKGACIPPEEHLIEGMQDGLNEIEQKVHDINDDSEYFHIDVQVTDRNVGGEIEEEESKENMHLDEDNKGTDQFLNKEILKNHDNEFSQNDAQFTDGNVVCEIEEEGSKENTHLDEDEKGIDQFFTKEISENHGSESSQNDAQGADRNIACEIQEEREESAESDQDMDQSITDEIQDNSHVNGKKTISISPGVEQALMTLEKAIYMVREYGFNSQSKSLSELTNKQPTNVEMSATKDSTISEDGVHPDVEESGKEIVEKNLQESRKSTGSQDCLHTGSNSYLREGNHNRIAPASPEPDLSNPDESNQVALSSSQNRTREIPIFDQTMHDNKQKNAEGNGFPEYTINGGKKLTQRFCCFPWNSA